MKLVLVHGRGQGAKNPTELRKSWVGALEKGLTRAGYKGIPETEIVFPFYGADLDNLAAGYADGQSGYANAKGLAKNDEETEFLRDFAIELAINAGVQRDELYATKPTVVEKGPLNWEWVHSILRHIDGYEAAGEFTLNQFTHDVFLYLKSHGIQKQIDAIVKAAIPRDEPCVVVGHSLGSIIAYRVLRSLTGATQVNAFITIGSPLGLKSVRRCLETPRVKPSNVLEWLNVYDKRDVVALLPLDQDTWSAAQPIENVADVNNDTDNRHGISGYLGDAHVGARLGKALGLSHI